MTFSVFVSDLPMFLPEHAEFKLCIKCKICGKRYYDYIETGLCMFIKLFQLSDSFKHILKLQQVTLRSMQVVTAECTTLPIQKVLEKCHLSKVDRRSWSKIIISENVSFSIDNDDKVFIFANYMTGGELELPKTPNNGVQLVLEILTMTLLWHTHRTVNTHAYV